MGFLHLANVASCGTNLIIFSLWILFVCAALSLWAISVSTRQDSIFCGMFHHHIIPLQAVKFMPKAKQNILCSIFSTLWVTSMLSWYFPRANTMEADLFRLGCEKSAKLNESPILSLSVSVIHSSTKRCRIPLRGIKADANHSFW